MLGFAQRHASATLALRDTITDEQIEALTDEADRVARDAKISLMRSKLRMLFLTGMRQAATARSTARIPTTVRYNAAAGDDEADRFVSVVRLEPVTVVASEMLEAKGGPDDHLHLLLVEPAKLAEMRDAQINALAIEYAEAEAANLVDAGWSEQ